MVTSVKADKKCLEGKGMKQEGISHYLFVVVCRVL